MSAFSKDFLWGAATAAYQVEGNNVNSDWWSWEKETGQENSGAACRHYELYEQDFDLAKSLNHNAHRLSIEWSRIEPREGEFSREALQHYLNVILALKRRGIEPLVTLFHFTNPVWLSRKGAWEKKESLKHFLRYCNVAVRALSKYVHYWITVNEPAVYASHAYFFGKWPPQAKSFWKAKAVYGHLAQAHVHAYQLIHKIYQELNCHKPSVSISQHLVAFRPCTGDLKNRFAVYLRNRVWNLGIIDYSVRHKALDFIGVNYYSRQLVDLKKWGIGNLAFDVCENSHDPVKKNSLGWDIYPQGLYDLLLKLKKYNRPVIITENGICTSDDDLRWEYISGHLKNIHLSMEKGVDVRGYLYWSLLDNFEWAEGFAPRFGLIEMDYPTQQRKIRPSARKFADVIRSGRLQ